MLPFVGWWVGACPRGFLLCSRYMPKFLSNQFMRVVYKRRKIIDKASFAEPYEMSMALGARPLA